MTASKRPHGRLVLARLYRESDLRVRTVPLDPNEKPYVLPAKAVHVQARVVSVVRK